ncbi:uncharacterized protein BT62DRAFT_86397 [Guyanagaster necrorhizus]|uniref:Uncharacterized protein n=1 Tax=Guyanagaster necrorhizus TaxID=856835 RepID=A0A9P8ATA3_9AGAR|nr:uncharacterized protein BT62DRAFT_86397 [Guyanagaster necrorhizus MCA 3950]KAG7446781.1 hypothetical protein BT62DRAFT_86397 [Guyanagaster necrorhizus MCA 3950]
MKREIGGCLFRRSIAQRSHRKPIPLPSRTSRQENIFSVPFVEDTIDKGKMVRTYSGKYNTARTTTDEHMDTTLGEHFGRRTTKKRPYSFTKRILDIKYSGTCTSAKRISAYQHTIIPLARATSGWPYGYGTMRYHDYSVVFLTQAWCTTREA